MSFPQPAQAVTVRSEPRLVSICAFKRGRKKRALPCVEGTCVSQGTTCGGGSHRPLYSPGRQVVPSVQRRKQTQGGDELSRGQPAG